MMKSDFPTLLENATTLSDVFEIVKSAVAESLGKSRGGLMLGLADLGNHPRGWLGAFYPVGSNVIVMNKIPLQRIEETNPKLYKPYTFHVLLHEYIHSLGDIDEQGARDKVYEITRALFGESHPATLMAKDTSPFFTNLVYPDVLWEPEDLKIELVQGFDRGNVCYIC